MQIVSTHPNIPELISQLEQKYNTKSWLNTWALESTTVVYAIYYSGDRFTIVCIQTFDMFDYKAENFLTISEGDDVISFESEDATKELMNTLIRPDYIDPEYIATQLPNAFF